MPRGKPTHPPAAVEGKGFTLLEILAVMAILGVLAALAVQSLSNARIRAGVARAQADLRTLATALEAYAVDSNDYPPNDGRLNIVPVELTTPQAYLSATDLADPFGVGVPDEVLPSGATQSRFYTYMEIVDYAEAQFWQSVGRRCPYEAIDHWQIGYNEGALEKYGAWRTLSIGPDRQYLMQSKATPEVFPPLMGSDIVYDPTNGTLSFGNILKTQKGYLDNR